MTLDSIEERAVEAVLNYRGIPLDLAITLAQARIAVVIAESSMDSSVRAKRAELAFLEIKACYAWLTSSTPGEDSHPTVIHKMVSLGTSLH